MPFTGSLGAHVMTPGGAESLTTSRGTAAPFPGESTRQGQEMPVGSLSRTLPPVNVHFLSPSCLTFCDEAPSALTPVV